MEISKERLLINRNLTKSVYTVLELEFNDQLVKETCLPQITSAMLRNKIDFGIDYTKPWEELDIGDHFQIEYLFSGEIRGSEYLYIKDIEIGINIYNELNFGAVEFGSDKILNLTILIDKVKIPSTIR